MRDKTIRRNCAEPSCVEWGLTQYSNRQELSALERKPWRCTRHTNPENVLSQSSPIRETVFTLSKVKKGAAWGGGFAPGLYWLQEGDKSGSGFIYGPGFKAFQKDFLEGTRIVITARIELPERDAETLERSQDTLASALTEVES